jgi:competence protein ComEC
MSYVSPRTWVSKHPRIAVVVILFCIDIAILLALFRYESGMLTVTFLDVGQGDAVLIEAPNGNQLLYDAGPPSGAVLRELGRALPFWDRSVDVVVLSHPDLDHIGGFPEIFKRYAIDLSIEPGSQSDNGAYEEVVRAIQTEGSGHVLARRGMRIVLGGGAYADILYPDRDMSTVETNSSSIVMRVVYGKTAFLLSGDLPRNIEEYIARSPGANIRANVLKAGHHGSRTSTSEYWLSAVAPEIVVVSAGKDNRYGHPHKDVVELLTSRGIMVLSTAEEGSVRVMSDGISIVRR